MRDLGILGETLDLLNVLVRSGLEGDLVLACRNVVRLDDRCADREVVQNVQGDVVRVGIHAEHFRQEHESGETKKDESFDRRSRHPIGMCRRGRQAAESPWSVECDPVEPCPDSLG